MTLLPAAFGLSLSKACPFLLTPKERQGFDKLSPNGGGTGVGE